MKEKSVTTAGGDTMDSCYQTGKVGKIFKPLLMGFGKLTKQQKKAELGLEGN